MRELDLTDREHLNASLRKLAKETSVIEGGWRRIGAEGGNPVAAVVSEIGETILPCRLALRNAAGAEIELDAAAGRLNRFVGPLPTVVNAFEAVCDRDFGGADTETLGQVLELLHAFAADGPFVWIRSVEAHEDPATNVGVAALTLAEALGVGSGQASDTDPSKVFEEIAEALVAHSPSWIKLSGDTVADHSDAADVEALRAAAARADQVMSATMEAGTAPDEPAYLVSSSADDRCVATLSLGEARVTASLTQDAAGKLTEMWLGAWPQR